MDFYETEICLKALCEVSIFAKPGDNGIRDYLANVFQDIITFRKIQVDQLGNLYIALSKTDAIAKVSFLDDGTAYVSDIITNENIIEPVGIAISDGSLFVANADGPTIGKIGLGATIEIPATQTTNNVASLNVADTIIELGKGDTIGGNTRFDGGGDQNATLKGHFTGDVNRLFHVRISTSDPTGDTIQWSYDSDFSSLGNFDSATGPTTFTLSDADLVAGLAEGISIEFDAKAGHDLNDSWQGDASPVNVQIGLIGNYNPPADSHAYSGIFRDTSDARWKLFHQYLLHNIFLIMFLVCLLSLILQDVHPLQRFHLLHQASL